MWPPPHAGAPLCSLQFIPEPPGGFKPRHGTCCTRELVAGMATCGTRRGSTGGPTVHDEPAFLVTTTHDGVSDPTGGFKNLHRRDATAPAPTGATTRGCCASVIFTETSPSPRLGRDHWASDPYSLLVAGGQEELAIRRPRAPGLTNKGCPRSVDPETVSSDGRPGGEACVGPRGF